MNEEELLKRLEKDGGTLRILIFLLFLLAPILLLAPFETENMILITTSQILLGSFTLIMVVFINRFDNASNLTGTWFSGEKFTEIEIKVVQALFLALFISIMETFVLFYYLLDYNLFEPEMIYAYIFTIIIVASGYPLMAYAAKIGRKKHGKSRAVRLAMKNKDAENLIKESLDSLGVEYEEYSGNRLKSRIWTLKLENGAEMKVFPHGRTSSIHIQKIPDDWLEKEREIEKEILRLVELETT